MARNGHNASAPNDTARWETPAQAEKRARDMAESNIAEARKILDDVAAALPAAADVKRLMAVSQQLGAAAHKIAEVQGLLLAAGMLSTVRIEPDSDDESVTPAA